MKIGVFMLVNIIIKYYVDRRFCIQSQHFTQFFVENLYMSLKYEYKLNLMKFFKKYFEIMILLAIFSRKF